MESFIRRSASNEVCLEVHLEALPRRLWACLTEPEPMGIWLGGEVAAFEPLPGRELIFEPELGPTVYGQVLELDPQRLLTLSWSTLSCGSSPELHTTLRIAVEPEERGARLLLRHTLASHLQQEHLFAASWELRLERLEALLAGREVPPLDREEVYARTLRKLEEESASLREHYARLLGSREEPERDLESLGLSAQQLLQLRGWLSRDRGLILTTGQRGAGATTTHYACLRHLMAAGRRVSTAEQPIHAPLPGALQLEADPARARSLGVVTREAFEAEAEVTLVGLLNDSGLAKLAIQAAAGRLVIALLWGSDPDAAREQLGALAGEDVEANLIGVLCQERQGSSFRFRLRA